MKMKLCGNRVFAFRKMIIHNVERPLHGAVSSVGITYRSKIHRDRSRSGRAYQHGYFVLPMFHTVREG